MLNPIQVILVIWFSGWLMSAPILATTQDFHWQGRAGYGVSVHLNYDETVTNQIIRAKGVGKTNNLELLTVAFYNPNGKLIHRYNNVVDGQSQGNYLEFNFNPLTHQPVGKLDLGGELSGEIFLEGIVDDRLFLIVIEPSGKEHVIDELSLI